MLAALCDDDKFITEKLKNLLLTYAKENRIIIEIYEFQSGERLLNSEIDYDIIVLDYQLGNTDGLTVAKELRKRNVLSCIIFLTSYPHFMIDAFEVNTFRFLLKPIDKSKLFKAIDDYVKIIDANYPITIIQNKELKKINSNEICFIEADGKYSNIHLSDKIMHCSKNSFRGYKAAACILFRKNSPLLCGKSSLCKIVFLRHGISEQRRGGLSQ